MTTVRFLNGLSTIGGNIVEFATKTSRVVMDFGTAVNPDSDQIDTLIAQHVLPHIPEWFNGDESGFEHEAIFVSHLHIDHMGGLKYLANQVPVYLSKPAYQLYRTLIALGIEQPIDNLHGIDYEDPISIGDLMVTGFESDHDTVGPMALLVSDGEHFFAHSGDVRLNGPHPEKVNHWMHVFQTLNLDLFMLEGTTFSFDSPAPKEVTTTDSPEDYHPLSEANLLTELQQHLHDNPAQLAVLNLYPRNVERLRNIQTAVEQQQRVMVWEPAFATILRVFYPDLPLTVASDQPLEYFNNVPLNLLKDDSWHYVLQNSFNNLNFLDNFNNFQYLHSNGEPLGDYDPRFKILQDYLADHHIKLNFLSCTGHASREDLLKISETVHAKSTVPWHSFHPERLGEALDLTSTEVFYPERDLYYTFD